MCYHIMFIICPLQLLVQKAREFIVTSQELITRGSVLDIIVEMLLILLVLNCRVLQEKLLGVLQWCLASSYHMILQSRYFLGNEENYTAKLAENFQADLKVCSEGNNGYSFCSPSRLPSSYSAGYADISAHKSLEQ
ncbi:uncharacterized protein LOC105160036 [Sesamum indicum]|uniref:Uncharacterized protein LOC105160036 n=1 Tax=Sesamum indicum TaxID=4182 RepID=A0A6I9T0Z6_SESIN|nr:uncharacterized protein LOC105160036 [Sesamum indicum]